MTVTAAQFVDQARTWIGVPFHHQGYTRDGCDCLGLLRGVATECGIWPRQLNQIPRYGRRPSALLIEGLRANAMEAQAAELGTLVLFRSPRERDAGHIAICAGATIIHAHGEPYGVVEVGYRGRWVNETRAFFKLPGVQYT